MTDNQYKILKYLYRKSRTLNQISKKLGRHCDGFYNSQDYVEFFDGVFFEYAWVDINDEDYAKSVYTIRNEGRVVVEARLRENRRWLIPVVISVVALVSGIVGWFIPLKDTETTEQSVSATKRSEQTEKTIGGSQDGVSKTVRDPV